MSPDQKKIEGKREGIKFLDTHKKTSALENKKY